MALCPLEWRHTEHTLELLADEGFLWHGDAVNDDAPYLIDVKGRNWWKFHIATPSAA